jgi:hypothetical protein
MLFCDKMIWKLILFNFGFLLSFNIGSLSILNILDTESSCCDGDATTNYFEIFLFVIIIIAILIFLYLFVKSRFMKK